MAISKQTKTAIVQFHGSVVTSKDENLDVRVRIKVHWPDEWSLILDIDVMLELIFWGLECSMHFNVLMMGKNLEQRINKKLREKSKIWANGPIHSFLVECLNPCLQRTNVRVGSPQPKCGGWWVLLLRESWNLVVGWVPMCWSHTTQPNFPIHYFYGNCVIKWLS